MTKPGFIVKQGASCFYLAAEGAGGFLNPPGDAEHSCSIREERGGRDVGLYSLRGVADCDWLPLAVKGAARRKLRQYTPQCTEVWVQSCYNYFRNCYSPDGEDRNVSHCVINRAGEALPVDHHLAVLHIRQWFPDHAVRVDLIAANGPLGLWSTSPKIAQEVAQ